MISLNQKQKVIIILLIVIMIGIILFYFYTKTNEEETIDLLNENIIDSKESEINDNITGEDEQIVIVHIAGEVKNPGIIKIKIGARIADVIEKAGGLNQEADITNINLAYRVEDGQKIIIPKKGEELQEYITEESQTTENQEEIKSKININKATIEQLQALNGIGEATAQKIIEYRKENGKFNKIEDLKNVPGIGDAKFETIKEKITV